MDSVKQELIERYQATGRVGFVKPKTETEALELIETINAIYLNEQENTEEVVISLHDIAEKLRTFFE